jgi:hypothetical protein
MDCTVIIDQFLNIAHDFGITLMSSSGHMGQTSIFTVMIPGRSWLGVENEWNGKEALEVVKLTTFISYESLKRSEYLDPFYLCAV